MRRGRIIRMGAACAILLLLLFALHKWSTDTGAIESERELILDSQSAFYKSHRNVYPTLKTGNVIVYLFAYFIDVCKW